MEVLWIDWVFDHGLIESITNWTCLNCELNQSERTRWNRRISFRIFKLVKVRTLSSASCCWDSYPNAKEKRGRDGSGAETQTKILVWVLNETKYKCVCFYFEEGATIISYWEICFSFEIFWMCGFSCGCFMRHSHSYKCFLFIWTTMIIYSDFVQNKINQWASHSWDYWNRIRFRRLKIISRTSSHFILIDSAKEFPFGVVPTVHWFVKFCWNFHKTSNEFT